MSQITHGAKVFVLFSRRLVTGFYEKSGYLNPQIGKNNDTIMVKQV
jgi:hypothetical protein